MSTDDVLARLGLQTRMTTVDYVLPALGVFGAGLVVGAGLGMLFAPRPGRDLRAAIGRRAGRMRPFRRRSGGSVEIEGLDDMSRDDLDEIAREHGVEGRQGMSRQELIEAISTQGSSH